MAALTITPGVLKVASAFPDPPFEVDVEGEELVFSLLTLEFSCGASGENFEDGVLRHGLGHDLIVDDNQMPHSRALGAEKRQP